MAKIVTRIKNKAKRYVANAKKKEQAFENKTKGFAAKAIAKEKELQKKALEHWSNAKKKIAVADKQVNSYMKKNPKKAVAIAAGVGAAIGAALTFALRKKR